MVRIIKDITNKTVSMRIKFYLVIWYIFGYIWLFIIGYLVSFTNKKPMAKTNSSQSIKNSVMDRQSP